MWDLDIFIDADLSMCTQVQQTVKSCFAMLRQLRSIRRSVPTPVYQSLVIALALSWHDYGNITLIGITAYQLHRLQSVMNAAARSITGWGHSDHITDTRASLHWLHSSEHIQYKLATTVFRSLHGCAPPYLSDNHRLVDIPSRRRLQSAFSLQLDVPRTHRRAVGDQTFAATSPTLWNSLPHDITDCVSLTSFCQKLKTFFVFYIISMTTFFFLVVLEVFTYAT